MNKKSEGASEVLSWVNRSRKIEDRKNSEREKALQLSKIFEEQVGNVGCLTLLQRSCIYAYFKQT